MVRVVIDTNVIISALYFSRIVPNCDFSCMGKTQLTARLKSRFGGFLFLNRPNPAVLSEREQTCAMSTVRK